MGAVGSVFPKGSAWSQEINVLPPTESMVTDVTLTTAAGPVTDGTPPGALMKRSTLPGWILLAVPAIQVEVSLPKSCQGCEVAAGMALLAMVAVRGVEVSKTCGDWPGPGTLCTRVPAGMGTIAGEPGAVARLKARTVEALTPGEGL